MYKRGVCRKCVSSAEIFGHHELRRPSSTVSDELLSWPVNDCISKNRTIDVYIPICVARLFINTMRKYYVRLDWIIRCMCVIAVFVKIVRYS